MTTQEHREPLLHWLQEFYATQVDHESLPGFISDELIRLDRWSYKSIPNSPQLLKILTSGDPGWYIEFGVLDIKKAETFLHDSLFVTSEPHQIDFDSCLDGKIKNDMLFLFSSPVYLGISLEAFRCYTDFRAFNIKEIEKTQQHINQSNALLNWVQDFFFRCCESTEDYDWEPLVDYEVYISMSLISTSCGWVMVWDLSDMGEEGEGHFEPVFIEEEGGTIDCYKTEYNLFIIRTHFRGLIKGLTIFKEWAEENITSPPED